jgi:ribosome recycling factor
MSIPNVYESAKLKMQKAVDALLKEFKNLRSGKANPAMLDGIKIDYYGTPTPLKQAANVSAPESRLIVIQPWDKSVLGIIEKEIQKADLGVNPSNDGKVIRLNLPQLTEEQRKKIAKVAHQKCEESKVAIRNARRESNEEIEAIKKAGHVSEDDTKRAIAEVQKITDEFIVKVDELYKGKEKEILTV